MFYKMNITVESDGLQARFVPDEARNDTIILKEIFTAGYGIAKYPGISLNKGLIMGQIKQLKLKITCSH